MYIQDDMFDDDEFIEDENEPKKRIERKCFCHRSYSTGKLLAICPYHIKKWGLQGKEIDWS